MPARHFNGTSSDYIDLSGTFSAVPGGGPSASFAAWVMLDAGAPQSVNGYCILGIEDNPLAFLYDIVLVTNSVGPSNDAYLVWRTASSSSVASLGLGNFAGTAWFLGMTINGATPKFYAGTSLDNIQLLGTATGWSGFPGSNPNYAMIGKARSDSTKDKFLGVINQVGLWWGQELTFSEMLDFAGSCAYGNAEGNTSQLYYPITGASPEPDLGPNAGSGTVHGTTVVDSICGGSSYADSEFAWFL